MAKTEPTVVHAYGVVAARAKVDLPIAGVGGAAVRRARCGDFAVIFSRHRAADLGSSVWEVSGQDPRWIIEVAQAHHEVLRRIVEDVDVLPLRLPGMYADEATMCTCLTESTDALRTAFQVVTGSVEWGVKVYEDARPASPPEQRRPVNGQEYLRMRAEEKARRDQVSFSRQDALLQIHESLSMAATHAALSPPHDREVTGMDRAMCLNAAYLVPRDRKQDFATVLDRLIARFGPEGYLLQLTGPWPAYNFTHLAVRSEAT